MPLRKSVITSRRSMQLRAQAIANLKANAAVPPSDTPRSRNPRIAELQEYESWASVKYQRAPRTFGCRAMGDDE